MAHLVRPWVVQHLDGDGKRVPAGTPGSKTVKKRARKWYAQWVPGWPAARRKPLAANKAVAQQMLADLVKQAERGAAGLAGPEVEHAKTPLATHLDAYEQYLRSKGNTAKHARTTKSRVSALLDGCKFAYLADVDAGAVATWLAAQRALSAEKGGIGVRTSNYYLRDAKSFFKWMVLERRAAENRLAYLRGGNADNNKRRVRRVIPPDEFARILAATRASTRVYRELSGEDRYHLYLTACGTGFRARELSTLSPASFNLSGEPPTVHVRGGYTKNRKTVRQPIPSALVRTMTPYLNGRTGDSPVWPGTWWERAAEMLHADLEAAGVPYVVDGPDGPLTADFHALRHSYITLLERSGVSPKQAQDLARHSDVRLTLGLYTHANLAGLGETVDRLALPAPGDANPNPLAGLTRKQLEDAVQVLAAQLVLMAVSFVCTPVCTEGRNSEQTYSKAERTGPAA